jgi:alpha-galactosidase
MKVRAFLALCLSAFALFADAEQVIRVSTDQTDLVFRVADNGRLYQNYLGQHLNQVSDLNHLPAGTEAYLTHGMEDYFEPALDVRHPDYNPSTLLKYERHEQHKDSDGSTKTVICLKDPVYGTQVALNFVAYTKENIIF